MERRSDGLLLVSLYHLACGLLDLFFLCVIAAVGAGLALVATGTDTAGDPAGPVVLAMVTLVAAGLFLVVAVANLIVAWGLWRRREWARVGALILAVPRLLDIPLGTVAGVLIIWYLVQPEAREQFAGGAPH